MKAARLVLHLPQMLIGDNNNTTPNVRIKQQIDKRNECRGEEAVVDVLNHSTGAADVIIAAVERIAEGGGSAAADLLV